MQRSLGRVLTEKILSNQYFFPLAIANVVVLGAHGTILMLRVRPSSVPIPLHYNTLFGIDAFGWWGFLFAPIAVGIGVVLFAVLLTALLPARPLRSILIVSFALITQLVLLISTFFIVQNILLAS